MWEGLTWAHKGWPGPQRGEQQWRTIEYMLALGVLLLISSHSAASKAGRGTYGPIALDPDSGGGGKEGSETDEILLCMLRIGLLTILNDTGMI